MDTIEDNFLVESSNAFKNKMLNWAKRFNVFCFLDNNNYNLQPQTFECILAAGVRKSIQLTSENTFEQLKQFSEENPQTIFGHFNYPSSSDSTGFPYGYFFIPEHIIKLSNSKITIQSTDINVEEIFNAISQQPDNIAASMETIVNIQCKISQQEYLEAVEQIKKHIQRGDCYELNFCQEFFSNQAQIDPLYIFHQLNKISPNPFSAFYKVENSFCLCASPERFLKKIGDTVMSQPIKGTARRVLDDIDKDTAAKKILFESQKERSENVMIVDLVRNDLSKFCTEGSVLVKELFGIYSFPQVHQMISTIECKVTNCHWTNIIESCYPMGSMTGAPKTKVMELIDKYEAGPRGLFSGAIGYVNADGDFDFNVVIRSIFYNTSSQYLSYKSGGGITFNSDPKEEYEESMLKAEAIKKILIHSLNE